MSMNSNAATMVVESDTVLSTIIAARRHLQRSRWIRHNNNGLWLGRHAHCARGAIVCTAHCGFDAMMALRWVEEVAGRGLTGYNDVVADSKLDVLTLFDQAIEAREKSLLASAELVTPLHRPERSKVLVS